MERRPFVDGDVAPQPLEILGLKVLRLEELRNPFFAGAASETLAPTEEGAAGFDRYTANFREAIAR